MAGRAARTIAWFDTRMATVPALDVAAALPYCEQRIPPHAVHQVRMEAVVDGRAVTLW